MPRRAIPVLAAAAVFALLPPAPVKGAEGGVVRRLVVACRSSNAQCWPTAFDFAPSGRIFYVERFSGQIRTYNPKTRRHIVWKQMKNVATSGEQGLLGLAVDPEWPDERWVYLYYTRKNPHESLVVRIHRRPDGRFITERLTSIRAGSHHNGGSIDFGPGGKLFAVTGDNGIPSLAQDRQRNPGKVLRMHKDGTVPDDNPFGNRVWSYGHRNSFGFAFDPATGRLWQTENGPECNDEINRMRKGRNFGWGSRSSCPYTNVTGPRPMKPARFYNPVIAPTGAEFCTRCGLGKATDGALLVGAWNDGTIRRLTLDSRRTRIRSSKPIYDQAAGILAVEAGPSGIYFSEPSGIYRLEG